MSKRTRPEDCMQLFSDDIEGISEFINNPLEEDEGIIEINSSPLSNELFSQSPKKLLVGGLPENTFYTNSDSPSLLTNNGVETLGASLNNVQIEELPASKNKSSTFVQKSSKQYAKEYRQKKKQEAKAMEEENKYLKSKVNQLNFRLRESELELNRLKKMISRNEGSSKVIIDDIGSIQLSRQKYLKSVQQKCESQETLTKQQINQIEAKIQEFIAFDSQKKIGILNYFMNEIFENLIQNAQLYFIDSMIEKKGIWAEKKEDRRKIDQEILELLGIDDESKVEWAKKSICPTIIKQFENFKENCKNLYRAYTDLITQGNSIEKYVEQIKLQWKQNLYKGGQMQFIKGELFFEKHKYRRDIRQIREKWMKSIMDLREPTNERKIPNKRIH